MIDIEKKGTLYISFDKEAKDLCMRSFFGDIDENRVIYSHYEALYLLEKGKAVILHKGKELNAKEIIKKLKEDEMLAYIVYKDLRKKGFILKPGIKFGGNFIVYNKGKKPGIHHSEWVVIVLKKGKRIKIGEIVGKTRIAHSTAKVLLLALIEGNKIMYYELKWKKI